MDGIAVVVTAARRPLVESRDRCLAGLFPASSISSWSTTWLAISSWIAKMSPNSRSKFSDQSAVSVSGSIICAVIRKRSPARRTVPYMT
jgi:hypothetical protein